MDETENRNIHELAEDGPARRLRRRFATRLVEQVKSHTGRRIVSGVFWTMVGSAVFKLTTFLSAIYIARYLVPSQYGEYGLVRLTVSLLVEIGGSCLYVGAAKRVAELMVLDKDRIGRYICANYLMLTIAGLLFGTILFVGAPFLLHTAEANSPVLAAAAVLYMFLLLLSNAQRGLLAGFQDFRGMGVSNIVAAVAALPAVIAGACYGGVPGAIFGLAAASGVSFLVNIVLIRENMKRHGIRSSRRGVKSEMSTLWNANTLLFAIGIANALTMWCPGFMVSRIENGFAQLGLFIAAMNFYTIIKFLPAQLIPVVIPLASTALSENNTRRYKKLILLFTLFALLVGSALALPVAFFAEPLIRLFGGNYHEAARILPYTAFAAVFASMAMMWSRFVLATGQMAAVLAISLLGTVLLVVTGCCLLAAGHGAVGMSVALLLSWAAQAAAFAVYVFFLFRNGLKNPAGS